MEKWMNMKRPIVALSPMADMSDTPFNLLCKKHGARLIFKEMVSSEAVVRGNDKTIRMSENDPGEHPIIQQIFGSDPTTMAKAASIVAETSKPDGIDINMGCPVYKIVSNFDGAALMKEPERASKIVQEIKKSVTHLPLSVKIRLGWSQDTDCIEFAKVLENAGVDAIEIHGRTKVQGYSGVANWERIGEVVSAVNIPVLLNGDVRTPDDALKSLEVSKAAGILIGRGALGNPFIFSRIEAVLAGQKDPGTPTFDQRIQAIRDHAALQIEHYGEHGLIKLRKHLPYYVSGVPGWKEIRQLLVHVSTMEDIEKILTGLKETVA